MTVAELIEILNDMPSDADVRVCEEGGYPVQADSVELKTDESHKFVLIC